MKKQLLSIRDKLQSVVDRAQATADRADKAGREATGNKYDAVAQNLYNAIEAIDDAIDIFEKGV